MTMDTYLGQMNTIPGWFWQEDIALFRFLLADQNAHGPHGDLAELGAYKGKSAIMLGLNLQPDETLTVVDLFGQSVDDVQNERENQSSYAGLARKDFEEQYTRFLPRLPTVVTGLSSEIRNHATSRSLRFMHVDASHLYEHVAKDIDAAQDLLVSNGVVALDDWRSAHTPGVTAATWEAIIGKGLRVICLTQAKLYGTWGDPDPIRHRLKAWLATQADLETDSDFFHGQELLRVVGVAQPTSRAQRYLAASLPPAIKYRADRFLALRRR